MELDHIFIAATEGAPEADALHAFGLTEGSRNVHPGQGTANRRFFFDNVFIELLWLADEGEARRPLTQPTRLFERLTASDAQASPFGIAFRPQEGGAAEAPFPAWPYRPDYLPPSMKIDVGQAPISEPMWFFLAFGSRPDGTSPDRRQPLDHAAGFREVTSLRLTLPGAAPLSSGAQAAAAVDHIEIIRGADHLLEIGFDGEPMQRRHSFRPHLPLIFRW